MSMFSTRTLGSVAFALLLGCHPPQTATPPPEFSRVVWSPADEVTIGTTVGFGADGTMWFGEIHSDSTNTEPTRIRSFTSAALTEHAIPCASVTPIRLGDSTTTACHIGRGDRYTAVTFFDWSERTVQPLPATAPLPLSYTDLVDCGDQNGDGLADLCTDAGVDYFPPDGQLDEPWTLPLEPLGRASVDLDGDGREEVFFVRTDGLYQLGVGLLEAGTGRPADILANPFVSGEALYLDSEGLYRLTAEGLSPWQEIVGLAMADGDFNGDGESELVIYQGPTFVAVDATGARTREVETHPDMSRSRGALAAGDLDGDACDDLLFSGRHVGLLLCPGGS